MTNKNSVGIVYLHNQQHISPAPRSHTEPVYFERLTTKKYQQQVQKSSLVFLSTLIQAEKSSLTEMPSFQINYEPRTEKPSGSNTLITSQQYVWSQPKNQITASQTKYLSAKVKKVEGEERSIVNLIGKVRRGQSKKKDLSCMANTLERNRTFSSIPPRVSNQGPTNLSHRKKQSKMKNADQSLQIFLAKRNSTRKRTLQSSQAGSIFINNNRHRMLQNANKAANLYSNIKQSKARSRLYNHSNYVQSTKRVQVESMALKTMEDSSAKEEGFHFRWTNMGHKHFDKLKTTPA